jgi:hypothetical protein
VVDVYAYAMTDGLALVVVAIALVPAACLAVTGNMCPIEQRDGAHWRVLNLCDPLTRRYLHHKLKLYTELAEKAGK